jgi:hypothetical protein
MKYARLFLVVAALGMTGVSALGGSHYVSGVEGIKAASLPPPGLYGRLYGVYYTADELKDDAGDKAPIGFDVSVHAVVARIIWVSQATILGGNPFMDALVPFIQTDLSIDALGLDSKDSGFGDPFVEPLGLSWHGDRFDAAVGAGVFLPVGRYDADEPASPGQDMWTTMLTAGGTLYLDEGRTWTASLLGRYEIHGSDDELDFRRGDDFHFEWGVGKTVANGLDVGLTGYCRWQVQDNKGADATAADRERVFAVGPEVSAFIPQLTIFVSLRSQVEFDARNTSEGHVTVLTFTKPL